MRRGLLLGTFDPIHIGHIAIAMYAINKDLVDSVVIIPTTQNPFKEHKPFASFEQRIKMCIMMASESEARVEVSTVEASLPEKHYTWDVLQALHKIYPNDELVLICGSDIDVNTWYNGEQIIRNYKIINFPRTDINCSSSELRQMLKSGENCYPYLTNRVLHYINKQHLYG